MNVVLDTEDDISPEEISAEEKKRVKTIISILENTYPNAKSSLHYKNPYELLVATILSAQSTDVQINKITPELFKKYPGPKELAKADQKELEAAVYSTGFYRNKAKNIKDASQMIVDEFDGKMPDTMDDLIRLPGVARKTANIVLANAFDRVVGIAVDTHVARLAKRLGLTDKEDPNKIEQDLMRKIDKKKWYLVNYTLIDHGRAICTAKNPSCKSCPLKGLCPSASYFLGKEDRK